MKFYLKIFHIKGIFQAYFCFVWNAKRMKIRLFGLIRPKNGLFRQKED